MTESPRDADSLVEMFQQWISQEGQNHNLEAFDQPIGLYQLIEAFTALRQEVKLETKSARQALTHSEEAIKQAQEAVSLMRSMQSSRMQELRPYLDALLDLDEALERGGRSIAGLCERARAESALQVEKDFDRYAQQMNWWRRILYGRYHNAASQLAAEYVSRFVAEQLERIEDGYALIRRRLTRLLTQLKIERIPTKGELFDPKTMTAVESIDCDDRPQGSVVEEIRAGYLLEDRPVRFAEVSVTRRPAPWDSAKGADSTDSPQTQG